MFTTSERDELFGSSPSLRVIARAPVALRNPTDESKMSYVYDKRDDKIHTYSTDDTNFSYSINSRDLKHHVVDWMVFWPSPYLPVSFFNIPTYLCIVITSEIASSNTFKILIYEYKNWRFYQFIGGIYLVYSIEYFSLICTFVCVTLFLCDIFSFICVL